MPQLRQAYHEWVLREMRMTLPKGRFDASGRWYPTDDELRDCCREVPEPSEACPHTLLVHCRSIGHVARLFGVNEQTLRLIARRDYDKRVQKLEDGNE